MSFPSGQGEGGENVVSGTPSVAYQSPGDSQSKVKKRKQYIYYHNININTLCISKLETFHVYNYAKLHTINLDHIQNIHAYTI